MTVVRALADFARRDVRQSLVLLSVPLAELRDGGSGRPPRLPESSLGPPPSLREAPASSSRAGRSAGSSVSAPPEDVLTRCTPRLYCDFALVS